MSCLRLPKFVLIRSPAVRIAPGLVAAALALAAVPASSAGDLQSQISAGQAARASLRAAIAAQTRQIGQTTAGLRSAEQRLGVLQAEVSARTSALRHVQGQLLRARNHLVDLENRLGRASAALAANLLARYENQPPNLMTVILEAHGFNSLLEQVAFARRIGRQDAQIIAITRVARVAVHHEAQQLAALEQRDTTLTRQVLGQRNEVAALQSALLNRQIAQIRHRGAAAARLSNVDDRLHSLRARQAAIQARAAAEAAAAARATTDTQAAPVNVGGIAVDTGGMVQAPAGAPAAVKEVIAAGNAIATMPYVYGGGHGSFHADGYDCSGSVSYALAAAGLVSSPLDSTGFESWGDPGPGQWITVYANAGHAWMEVAGWRFDTVAQASSGTRWAQGGGEFAGMVERHPPGL